MRILTVIGLLAILVGIGAAGFFFGGIYSVAGTADRSRGATLRHALVVLGLRLTFSPHSELAPGKLLPASPPTAVATRGGD